MQAGRALLVLCSWALLPVVQSKQCTRADAVGGGQSWTFDLSGCATLDLSGPFLWSSPLRDEGARALAEALEANGALTALLLDGNSIGDKAQAAVDAVLAVPPKERPRRYGARAKEAAERPVAKKPAQKKAPRQTPAAEKPAARDPVVPLLDELAAIKNARSKTYAEQHLLNFEQRAGDGFFDAGRGRPFRPLAEWLGTEV